MSHHRLLNHVCLLVLGLLVLGLLVMATAAAGVLPQAKNLVTVLLVVSVVALREVVQGAWESHTPPRNVRLACCGHRGVIGLASTMGWQDGPVYDAVDYVHPICTRRMGIVLWAGFGACVDGVAVVDVATMGAAVLHILACVVLDLLVGLVSCREWLILIEVRIWLVGVGLLLHLVPGLLLPVSSASAATAAAPAAMSAMASGSLALLLLVLHWLLELHRLPELH